MKDIALFGSGYYGKRALDEYGADKIACFIDNDKQKHGKSVEGVPIVGLEEYMSDYNYAHILISTTYMKAVSEQLDSAGITDYGLYLPKQQYYYSPEILIDNPYTTYRDEAIDEEDWNKKTEQDGNIEFINQCVKILQREVPLFNHVEIETYNRCNGVCEFCPVSVKNETRVEKRMDEALFRKIIGELKEISYDGKLALFSNNEPFLDERIIEFHRIAREQLPNARMHLYTNGTLLSLDKFVKILDYLDEIVIDNYNQNLDLIPNNRKIRDYCEEHPELIKKVTIVMRKPKEILTSRGGDAPNRKELISYENDSCMLPYRQMIIRPDGKVSLCCNDPLGRTTLGDLNEQSILEVWYGDKFGDVRNSIAQGRGKFDHCKYCDSFIVG